ncbi:MULTISPECIES: DUF6869 domain-containing protein [unclassified Legionella]|uniref:DUF6869 domain-containing protein n=1 Tax=unclassified Legionella TaxID=2622702 RepID=UPI001E5FAEAB|nr:hypothetical protein [Legionella sp. 31fI33]MCC5015391.1 hypothetical protein [Legionella sp. 31fI33]
MTWIPPDYMLTIYYYLHNVLSMLNEYISLAEVYLEAFRKQLYDDSLVERIDKIITEPIEGISFIEALLAQATNLAELAYIAAGPLEDFFIKNYEVLEEPFDKLLRTNSKMRQALTGIWISENTKARITLDKLLDKYHLTYGSL